MRKRLIVLSLFDGIGCGHEALNRAGIRYRKFYASEINKKAILVAMKNHPDTIQVGNVCDLRPEDFKNVDLIIGGSPCQNISVAGNKKGITTKSGIFIKSLEHYEQLKANGEKFNESALFWEFVRMYRGIKKYNPNVKFFLENVTNKQWEEYITKVLGVQPKTINSALITAQNRNRNYWTDIPLTPLKDLKLEIKHYIPGAVKGAGTRGRKLNGDDFYSYPLTLRRDNKANCLTCTQKPTGRYLDFRGVIYDLTPEQAEILQTLSKGYTNIEGLSNSARFKMIGNAWTVDVIVKFFENL